MIKILSIDPSIQHVGYALFHLRNNISIHIDSAISVSPAVKLIAYDSVINHNERTNWIFRLDYMIGKLQEIATISQATHIIIEQPECYSSRRGVASLASGAVPKLFSLVFALRQAFLSGTILANNIVLVPVSHWKGQCPKEVTMKRMCQKYSLTYEDICGDHNISDAIGIGDYYIHRVLARKALYACALASAEDGGTP